LTVQTEWEEGNDRYLNSALSWLRLRLEQLSDMSADHGSPPSDRSTSGRAFLRNHQGPPSSVPTPGPISDDQIAKASSEMEKAAEIDPPPALVMLSHILSLTEFEQDILLLCAAMELDTRIPALCAKAQDSPYRPYPTFALALALFKEPHWDAFLPDRPLRHWQLVEISQVGAGPLSTSPLRADERIVSYIKGLNILDDRLSPFLIPCEEPVEPDPLPPSQQERVERIVETLRPAEGGRLPVIELTGPYSGSKELVARHASAALGRHMFRMTAAALPSQADDLESLGRLVERESTLVPISLFIGQGENEAQTQSIYRFVTRSNGVIFLDVLDVTPIHCPHRALTISRPTRAEQEEAWRSYSPKVSDEFSKALAGQFSMDVQTIRRTAGSIMEGDAPKDEEIEIWKTCVATSRPKLEMLAQKIEPKATMGDLVLPEREARLLHDIASQVKNRRTVYDEWGFGQKMNRGLGITALFSGESGTGKTMAAEAIANELFLDLFRIDLSQVVNKYIGETEKNLRRVFDAAEEGGVILFFDEADALFGKRSEVKDSHDRYANIEINYLLQRIEAFPGLAILATNAKSALDPAFVRRLRFIVEFPYPGPAERRAIWEKVFPKDVPCEKLDLDRLTRFNLTGGSIHNIALNSAFLAADSKQKVTMQLVLDAIKTELLKMNKPVIEAEFR
jgi:AAA+ superfamily predicted ATPase